MGVGVGPVPLHAEMTSGSSGTIRSVAADTTEAMAKVRESIELIRYAQDRPSWDSDAGRRSYNMRAWATRASSEICFNRLNRVTLALEVAECARNTQAELGWVLDPAFTGHGYATEAVEALIRLCFVELGVRRVVANCFLGNESSWRLMGSDGTPAIFDAWNELWAGALSIHDRRARLIVERRPADGGIAWRITR